VPSHTHALSRIIFSWQIPALVCAYAAIRVLSFILAPHAVLQALIVFMLWMVLAALYFKNPVYAWYMVVSEILLGGSGQLFELFGVSIRTIFIFTFMLLWFLHHASTRDRHHHLKIPHKLFGVLMTVLGLAIIGTINGLLHGNAPTAIIADAIPYAYLVLILPAYHLLRHATRDQNDVMIRLLIAFVLGSAFFAVINEILFATGIEVLHDPYYKWYRDVALGKLTYLGDGFYRVVANSHLVVPLITVITASILMGAKKHRGFWYGLLAACAIILALNFSRAYLLGVLFGFFFLLRRHSLPQWLPVFGATCGLIVLAFMGTHLAVSGGSSLGLGHVSSRFGAIVGAAADESVSKRRLRLGPSIELIKESPVFGHGLGATIQYYDASAGGFIQTSHLDWGYLEIWAELGLVGSAIYVFFISLLLMYAWRRIDEAFAKRDLFVGIFGALVCLLVMHMFTPSLFHSLGMLFLVFVVVVLTQPLSILEYIAAIFSDGKQDIQGELGL
jgi:O-antigen ligase